MAKGEHVRTFWPLMLQCGSEDGDNYSAGFEKLQAELIESGIPSPSQVHLDWFSSSKKAAQRVWPRALVPLDPTLAAKFVAKPSQRQKAAASQEEEDQRSC